MKEKLILRQQYIDKIRPFIGRDLVKIITGQRRIGKSYMLKQLIEEIKKSSPQTNIIYIDKELEEFSGIRNNEDLHKYVREHLAKEKDNFLFIDEIQEIESFQRCIRSLLNQKECDIYCTGSNATMLSGEIATLLAGRYIEFPIHGLSYPEFLEFNQIANSNENLNLYLTLGGMPYQYHLGLDPAIVFEYLKSLYSTILLKDVVSRENIRNVSLLENLVTHLADNTGSLFSAQNISKYLKSQRINIPTQSVINYLRALTNAYFIHKVSRADIQGLKIFEIGEKFYFEDLGLRNSIRPFNYRSDIGKLMENAVYLHLIRNSYTVYVGKSGDKEIDFMAEKAGEKLYVQVAYQLGDENIIKREFGNLSGIPDNYPKYVVTMDEIQPTNTYRGIRQVGLKDLLMNTI
ncbi:MAG: ATP-binding protein [Puia sp.]|nr:ATP-binding protein [Puia sp.]